MKKLWMPGFNLRTHFGDARLKVTIVAVLTIFTLVPCFSTMAQEDDAFMLEEITVTGSRIRGVEGVGTSVIGLDRETINISAGVSVDAIIKELPSIMDLGITEVSRAQSGGQKNNIFGSGINIHGIGPYSTLILLDGHRVTNNGQSFNPGTLPSIGIDRIEVVADGASAIYGTDAIAGVVNLIPRRKLNGVETSFRIGSAADMDPQWQAGAAVGKMWDSGQFMVAYEHVYRGSLNGDDRDFYTSDQRSFGGADYRVTLSSPGNITAGGKGTAYPETKFAIPEGGVTPATAYLLVPGTVNLYNDLAGRDILPEQEYNNANFTFNQAINNIEFFADGFYSKREFSALRGMYAITGFTVPSTNAFFVQPPGMSVKSYKLDISFADMPGFGPDTTFGYSKNWEITPGIRINLPYGFQLEALYNHGETRDLYAYEKSQSNTPAINAALASSDPATALDIYGLGRTSAETIAAISTRFSYAPTESDFAGYEVGVNGPVFDVPGGTVKLAAGYEGQRYDLHIGRHVGYYPEPKNIAWNPALTRDVDSGYLELFIPVVGRKNATTGINRLELTAAVRYDSYSDFGDTTNPKIGFNYSPIEMIMFHGSYGTSFRAPLLDDGSNTARRFSLLRLQDPSGGPPVSVYALEGGNDDLIPEEATNWSLGAVFNPTENTEFSLNYFSVDYDKQIESYLSQTSILAIESEFVGSGVILRGAEAGNYVAELVAEGLILEKGSWPGGDPHNVDLFIDGRPMNLGLSTTQGIDFMVSHNLRTETAGSFRFTLDGTYFTKYEIAYTENGTIFDTLNEMYNPLRFKARGAVTWNYRPFTTQVAFRYVNSYNNTAVTPVQKVDSYMPVDIIVRFNGDNVGWLGSFGTGLSISLEARNAFDLDPPYVNIATTKQGGGGFDPTAADPVGRLIALSLRKSF